MSEVSAQTKQRPEYGITLDAPNASEPTYKMNVDIHNIYVGPKRTVRRMIDDYFSQPVYLVPAPSTWTLDTVRALLHAFATFLPEKLDENTFEAGVRHERPGLSDERFYLVVRARVSDKHAIEVTGNVEAKELSDPMRAVLSSLPSDLAPLAGLRVPESIGGDEWEKKYATSLTVNDAHRIEVLLRRIKALCYLRPKSTLDVFEQLVKGLDPHGDSEE